ncbi:hypothetical protein ACFQ0Q_02740 [Streptomyces aureus]
MSNLTPSSPLRDWLADPAAGRVLRGLLASQGQSEQALAPALGLPLEQLVKMSGGKFPPQLVDALVTAAETGRVPEGLPTAPRPTPQRPRSPTWASRQATPNRGPNRSRPVASAARPSSSPVPPPASERPSPRA